MDKTKIFKSNRWMSRTDALYYFDKIPPRVGFWQLSRLRKQAFSFVWKQSGHFYRNARIQRCNHCGETFLKFGKLRIHTGFLFVIRLDSKNGVQTYRYRLHRSWIISGNRQIIGLRWLWFGYSAMKEPFCLLGKNIRSCDCIFFLAFWTIFWRMLVV